MKIKIEFDYKLGESQMTVTHTKELSQLPQYQYDDMICRLMYALTRFSHKREGWYKDTWTLKELTDLPLVKE
jgi:hypothetical protein